MRLLTNKELLLVSGASARTDFGNLSTQIENGTTPEAALQNFEATPTGQTYGDAVEAGSNGTPAQQQLVSDVVDVVNSSVIDNANPTPENAQDAKDSVNNATRDFQHNFVSSSSSTTTTTTSGSSHTDDHDPT